MDRLAALITMTAVATLGCVSPVTDDGPELAISSRSDALGYPAAPIIWRLPGGSLDLVGRDLNGRSLNGSVLDDRRLAAVRLDSARFGERAARVTLDGSQLKVKGPGASQTQENKAIGIAFTGTVDDGTELTLQVESVERGSGEWKDVYRYTVSYHALDGVKPLCGVDSNGDAVKALALSGRWDYREGVAGGGSHIEDAALFTFACDGYVIAKCVDMGYVPWRPVLACTRPGGCNRMTLVQAHQACTRMLRADYCGDGASHTQDGVAINVHDAFGIRTDDLDWAWEAEWDESGARCAVAGRLPSQPVPPCAAPLSAVPECGAPEHLLLGTLLISEVAQ